MCLGSINENWIVSLALVKGCLSKLQCVHAYLGVNPIKFSGTYFRPDMHKIAVKISISE